jgi:DNA-binding MarR family transcriptional regulator
LTYQQSTYKQLVVSIKPVSSTARYQALLQLLRTAETLWNASRVFFDRWELSPSQFNILNLLHLNPEGCTQIELSRLLIMHRSNITGLVDRLEKRGLLQRKDNPADRRAYKVVLTSAGRRLIEKILPDYYAAAEMIWGNFPVMRTKQLVGDLEKLSANIESFSEMNLGEP